MMASFNRPRFPAPMFNQNFPRGNFSMGHGPERQPVLPFQRVPNPPFRPFQTPERFMPANFQERPRFSNFPDPASFQGFRNRPPRPETLSPMTAIHPPQRSRFGGPFERPPRPWNPRPPFMGPRSPFQHRPRAPLQSYPPKDLPLQANRTKKQKTKEPRKLKDDNTEKPFSCDTCDRAFVTENELNNHFSEHVKCDNGNCMFEAHPKIVALHKKMQHETGYADAINKLQNDEEIRKWREERRNRFPTAENIKKRKAEQAEKEARGEVLETKEFGKFKRRRDEDHNLTNHEHFKRQRNRRYPRYDRRYSNFHNRQVTKPVIIDVDSESDSDSDSHISLNEFSGISSLTSSSESFHNEKEHSLDPHNTSAKELSKESVQHVSTCNLNTNGTAYDMSSAINISSNVIKSNHAALILNGEKLKDIKSPQKTVSEASVVLQENSEVLNEDLKQTANDSVCEVSVVESPSKKHSEVVNIAESDDEGPAVVPIIKSINKDSNDDIIVSFENSSANETSRNGVHEYDALSEKTCAKDANVPLTASNVAGFRNNSHFVPSKLNGDRCNRNRNNHRFNQNSNVKQATPFVAKKSTLLEKLLADDIRHERNVILQCVRHVVNNNFFGIGSN